MYKYFCLFFLLTNVIGFSQGNTCKKSDCPCFVEKKHNHNVEAIEQVNEINSKSDKIVVFGANSSLGKEIIKRLDKNNKDVHMVFSSDKSLQDFTKNFKNVPNKHLYHVVDIRNLKSFPNNLCDNAIVVICSASRPKLKNKISGAIFWMNFFLQSKLHVKNSDKSLKLSSDKIYSYEDNKYPKDIDWLGQKNIIDHSKNSKHVILSSSMGGTYINCFLNKFGKGDVLLWKRKSEMYLKNSGIPYTIIHPPRLTYNNKSCRLGDLILGVNDFRDEEKACHDKQEEFFCDDIISYRLSRCELSYFITRCIDDVNICKNKSFDIVKRKDKKLTTLRHDSLNILFEELGKKEYDYSRPKHVVLGN